MVTDTGIFLLHRLNNPNEVSDSVGLRTSDMNISAVDLIKRPKFSKRFIDAIEGLSIPVIISSRTGGGVITRDSLLCKNTVSAGDLSPQKAAILLRLALTQSCSDRKQLKRMFSEY